MVLGPNAPRTARERVREELTREIRDAARLHLAEHGSAGLSLRAVARDLGMASSAVYRYFPSRDDLLTALIIDAYEAAAEAAERTTAAVPADDLMGRWVALCTGLRGWAVAHPQEYALIFGSPIPGYRAPQDTVDPAARIPLALIQIMLDAQAAGRRPPPVAAVSLPAPVRGDLAALGAQLGSVLDEVSLGSGLMAWTELVGTISFELFGHLHNVIHDYAGHFDYQMRTTGTRLGL